MALEFIKPDWQAPVNVKAITTTRGGGVSELGFQSLNLAGHVGDNPEHVAVNRQRLVESLALPAEPLWLNQVHGVKLVNAARSLPAATADGSYSSDPGTVCAVLTADCLPVFLCDRAGSQVAVVHAGWRGLAQGIVEAGVAAMRSPPSQLLAWLGPAIGTQAFEVGEEVRRAFVKPHPEAGAAFVSRGQGKWLADIYVLARQRLQSSGLEEITGGDYCCYSDYDRFFSFRREPRCGRMASIIWLDH